MPIIEQSIEADEIEIVYEEGSDRKWVCINGQRMRAASEVSINFIKDPLAEVTITFVTNRVTVTRKDDGRDA